MLTNSEAIILGYINYSETSIILKAYTKDFGFKSFIIKGIRSKKKKKITLGQLQALTILDIEFNNTKNNSLSYLKNIKIKYKKVDYLIRKSGTENLLRIMVQSKNKVEVSEVLKVLVNLVKKLDG